MKYYSFFLVMLCFSTILFSCKKEAESNDDTGLSQDIKNFVPQSVIDSMRKWGMIINEGKNPPVITGIYNFTRNLCVFDNSRYNQTGDYFADYRFRFRNQDNDKLTISLDYKALSAADSASGVGSFIAGNDNSFTVFVNIHGVAEEISYAQIGFYSGIKTENGIDHFQTGFYLTEKGPDPSNKIVAVGSSRIFNDEDEQSETNAVYRPAPKKSFIAGK